MDVVLAGVCNSKACVMVAMNCLKPIFGGLFSLPISSQSLHTDGGGRTIEIFEITATSAFSTNIQSRFASVVLDGVLGPLRLA